jgi:hypothetical protein
MDDIQDDILFFNVFGAAIILQDRISVSVNAYKRGRLRAREFKQELTTQMAKLQGIDSPILVPFCALLSEDEILYLPGRMTDRDAEKYVINKSVIEPIIKNAIGLIRGALLKGK